MGVLDKKLKDIWDDLPDLEHTKKYFDVATGFRFYEVCGKKFQETTPLYLVIEALCKYYDNYGKRAILAKENKFLDFKAISHALRAGYQVKRLLTEGTIIFPLPEAEFLKDVKLGKLNYIKEVAPVLEDLMEKVEQLSKESKLPNTPDKEFWENFIINTIEKYVL